MHDVLRVLLFVGSGAMWASAWTFLLPAAGFGLLIPVLGLGPGAFRALVLEFRRFFLPGAAATLGAFFLSVIICPDWLAILWAGMPQAIVALAAALASLGVAVLLLRREGVPGWIGGVLLYTGSFTLLFAGSLVGATVLSGLEMSDGVVDKLRLMDMLSRFSLFVVIGAFLLSIVSALIWLAARTGVRKGGVARLAKILYVPLIAAVLPFLATTEADTMFFDNFLNHPILFVLPAGWVGLLVALRLQVAWGRMARAWGLCCLFTWWGIVTAHVGMYPALVPSLAAAEFNLGIDRLDGPLVRLVLELAGALLITGWCCVSLMRSAREARLDAGLVRRGK